MYYAPINGKREPSGTYRRLMEDLAANWIIATSTGDLTNGDQKASCLIASVSTDP